METLTIKKDTVGAMMSQELSEVPSMFPQQAPVERRITFPERLWECVNDNSDLIRWGAKGDSLLVAEERFEKEVMMLYPGLVAISSFANFRRQLRAYNFDWFVNNDGEIEFVHPQFIKGHPELIGQIRTKRRVSNRYGERKDNGDRVGTRTRGYPKDKCDDRDEGASNVEGGKLKAACEPKRKRKYLRRRGRPRSKGVHDSFTSSLMSSPIAFSEIESPVSDMSPPAGHSGMMSSGAFRPGFSERPPGQPFCSCPWHCPVNWESYEAMMQGWTKGGPPPPNQAGPFPPGIHGYWQPPPFGPPPPMCGPFDPCAHIEISKKAKHAERAQLKKPAETDKEHKAESDLVNCNSSQEELEKKSTRQNATKIPRDQYTVPKVIPPPHCPYPVGPGAGMPDPWRFQGGPPLYPGMPFGPPPPSGHKQAYQYCHPHMPYTYPEFIESSEEILQDTSVLQPDQENQINATSQATKSEQTSESSKPPESCIEDSLAMANSEQSDTNGTQIYQTIDEEMMQHAFEANVQNTGVQEIVIESPFMAQGAQQFGSVLQAEMKPIEHVTLIPHNPVHCSVECSGNGKRSNPSKSADEVTTQQLITNVGIQQHQMMVLMNQQQEEGESAQDDIQEEFTWVQEQPCAVQEQISTWAQPKDQAWDQLETNESPDATVVRDTNTLNMKTEQKLEGVQLADQSQQPHCSGPLDLSSTEVTVVTVNQNVPVSLAAVIKDKQDQNEQTSS